MALDGKLYDFEVSPEMRGIHETRRELMASVARTSSRMRAYAAMTERAEKRTARARFDMMVTRILCGLAALTLLGLILAASGCGSLQEQYVRADALTYAAVADEYSRYVEADASLDSEQKESRRDTIASWRARIDSALDNLAEKADGD